ncbi:hypothetical protein SOVF_141580 [Spinacia oleracea]|uniref:Uncharacterized protein n=1 Tax=Spinacia oleracea TaxID=3562 RepID=A0A9R0I410_SPIOL|nr:uncharacterized protein LOC110782264 [Spinacia oleracea]KNA10724.1 hypothetical protein SOVF_141580 [Spinacia oleracea]
MQRSSVAGRPSGTDGSDYSYRMVVDSRYTKVAKEKGHLAIFLSIQALVLLVGIILVLLPVVKGEDYGMFGLEPLILSFLSLVAGELGRRQSRTTFLKIYLIMSFVAVFEVIHIAVANYWVKQRLQALQLIEVLHIFIEVLVKISGTSTTLSLIDNMSIPKRSS